MNKPNFRPTDFTHPNNDRKTAMTPLQQSSPLMGQVQQAWGLPWPRKPLSDKAKSGKGTPKMVTKTYRSGVHRLGQKHKKSY